MQCLYCGGAVEWAGDKARCSRCLNLFQHQNGQLQPVVVEAPGGGWNPEFNQMFQQQLGFGPPPPGAVPRPPGPQQPQQQQGALGGIVPEGLNIRLHGVAPVPIDFNSGGIGINQQKLEKKLEDKAKSMIIGWIIGAVILGIIVIGGIGFGIYIWAEVKSGGTGPSKPTAGGDDTAWDGKTPFSCKGNETPKITGTVANLAGKTAITVSSNCKLTLENVQITAAVGIETSSNGQVVMNGGSINATTNTAVASGNSQIVITGAKLTGKSKQSGNAKVTAN
jgi:hypothetical protein